MWLGDHRSLRFHFFRCRGLAVVVNRLSAFCQQLSRSLANPMTTVGFGDQENAKRRLWGPATDNTD